MFSKRLKILRNEKGISQADLAKIINSSTSKVSMWEVGKRDPNTDDLNTLADYFNVTIDYLLGRTDIRNPYNNEEEEEEKPIKYEDLEDEIIAAHKEGEFTEEDERIIEEVFRRLEEMEKKEKGK